MNETWGMWGRVPRLFVAKDLLGKRQQVWIAGVDAHHLSRVLRLRVGDPIAVGDRDGLEYPATIAEIAGDKILLSLGAAVSVSGEPAIKVTLVQGLPKAEKMDFIVQKCTELGVAAIQPLICHRSIVKLTPGKARERVDRWQRIAEEAAKQCGRGTVPRLYPVLPFRPWLEKRPSGLLLMPWEGELSRSLHESLVDRPPVHEVHLLIGPEGGFDDQEVADAVAVGAECVSLGPRILRTETAGMATLAALMFAWGDFGRPADGG